MMKKCLLSRLISPWLSAQRLSNLFLQPSLHMCSGLQQLDFHVRLQHLLVLLSYFPLKPFSVSFFLPSALSVLNFQFMFIQLVPLIGSLTASTRSFGKKKVWQRICFFPELSFTQWFIRLKRTHILNTSCVCDTVLRFHISITRVVHLVFNKYLLSSLCQELWQMGHNQCWLKAILVLHI